MTSWQEQYKKTLVPMQIAIAAVVVAVGIWSRTPAVAAVFLVVMQASAVLGALWAVRLKRKVERSP